MGLLMIEIFVFLMLPGSAENLCKDAEQLKPQETCTECHSDKIGHEVMHEALDNGCDICHESTGEVHPGEGKKGFKLVDQSPALCYYCHEEAGGQAYGHKPVREGECLSCHDVHGSSNPALSKLPDPDLCLFCHPLAKGKVILHSAIEGGGCMICHQPHGTERRSLLVETFPEDAYAPASAENFGICFICHDTDLLDAEQTDWATNFRNGDRNLHQLHIQGEKGRSCILCHNLHVSKQKFLIEEKIRFGDWEMRMNFIPTENGGSCLPGCHGKASYARQ
jgi:predicted CXXCH cytochrome family protein